MRITLASKALPPAFISLEAVVSMSDHALDFENLAMASVADLDAPYDNASPHLTYRAVESACMSGAIYARRKANVQGVKVRLESVRHDGLILNAAPFATAMTLLVLKALCPTSNHLTEGLEGWLVQDDR